MKNSGILYIVATPIGNLKDITLRALEILKEVDLVISEDSRMTGNLLQHFQIQKKQFVLNDFNEVAKIEEIITLLKEGRNLALVSDAGTPLISDPGFKLVREARANDIEVTPIPGASSTLAALSASGLPSDRFYFAGFPPPKGKKRSDYFDRLETALKQLNATVIVYEAPLKLKAFFQEIEHLPVQVCLARELTKMHEEFIYGTPKDLVSTGEKLKGEVTVLLKSKS